MIGENEKKNIRKVVFTTGIFRGERVRLETNKINLCSSVSIFKQLSSGNTIYNTFLTKYSGQRSLSVPK
jgi:uncharacterized protein (DUF1810 family)